MCRLVMLSFKKRFGTSRVISDQASMYMCSLVSVFCSRLFSVNQLTFEIYIILCQYSDHKKENKFGEINILESNFLSSSYGNESHKSVGCNSYTMGCPPVRGDNPRALASGLSYVQVDKHGITNLYHLHQCRPCTSRDISC